MGFLHSSDGNESACSAGDLGTIPGSGRSPREGSLPGKSQGQRSLMGCSPWGHKESGTTEQLTHTHTHTHTRVYGLSGWVNGDLQEGLYQRGPSQTAAASYPIPW